MAVRLDGASAGAKLTPPQRAARTRDDGARRRAFTTVAALLASKPDELGAEYFEPDANVLRQDYLLTRPTKK